MEKGPKFVWSCRTLVGKEAALIALVEAKGRNAAPIPLALVEADADDSKAQIEQAALLAAAKVLESAAVEMRAAAEKKGAKTPAKEA